MLSPVSHVQLCAALWTIAHQAPLSVGFSNKNSRVGCSALLQGNLPNPGMELTSLCVLRWQVGSLPLMPPGKPSGATKESENEVAQSCPTLCNPMDVAYQAPPSMDFSRHEYWSGLPLPSSGDLPHPGIEPGSPALQADLLGAVWLAN